MQKVYGSLQPEMDVREKKHAALAREAAGEGFVLLENNGVLPLKDKKVALYGMGARKTVAGGTGSGEVQKRYTVSIEEGLENAGYLITTKQYLDDYDRTYEMSYQAWRDEVEESIAPLKHPIEALMKALSFSYRYPAGRLINQQDVEASQTDTAIYVIMRQAGEGNDRKWEEGDFLLTEEERANVAYLTKAYKDTIVVVNVGGMIDLSFMEELPGISALIYFVQGGMEGGNAFADVVSGKVNFSGKLTDSWPMAYKDIPAGESYSYLNGNLDNEDYTEGIYVGYRYYDSYGIKPRYAFGYGLSYTQFAMTTEKTWLEGTKVFAKVQVQNIGNVSGKEVVQAYVSCPVGKLHKEYQRLVAFAKTPVLAPDEVTTLTLSFDMTQAASFDERLSRWVLEAGDYVLRLGNASDCTQVATAIALEELVVTEVCQKLCAPVQQLTEIEIPASVDHEASETGVLYVEASAFNTLKHTYSEPIEVEDETTKEILDTLTIEEMAELVRGADLQTVVDGMHNITAAVGRTATTLQHKGLRNILFADGPAGVSVMEHVRIQEDGSEKAADIPSRYNWGPVADMMRMKNVAETGTDVYRYATAWPVEALLAQSWNLDLMQRIGQATGEEMELFGITLWLAPGMNIHRNPLCGRTFEYFSEDPYVSGKMAAAITQGVQSKKGVGTTIKHFCANNQEDNRNYVSSNINERALREIYLKGFEIAVKESQPKSVMTSYNKLNGTYTANHGELLNGILRNEWGFEGLVMTDWNSCGNTGNGNPALCVPAGNDLVMPGSAYDQEMILEALKKGEIRTEVLRSAAARVLKVMQNALVEWKM